MSKKLFKAFRTHLCAKQREYLCPHGSEILEERKDYYFNNNEREYIIKLYNILEVDKYYFKKKQ